MYDFCKIGMEVTKKSIVLQPQFRVRKSKDLMIRGRDFYCVWDEESGLWSQDEDTVFSKIDTELLNERAEMQKKSPGEKITARLCIDSRSGVSDEWHKYVQKQMRDNYKQLDSNIIFSNQETKKEDYASKKLPYPLQDGPHEAYDEIMSTLYDKSERRKLEWAIGAIISGDAKNIQKFIVLFGAPGTGKSTFLKIVKKLFGDYCKSFDSKKIASNDPFALEAFKSNPLIALDDEGDLSKIETNTKLNGIVAHDTMVVNEKNKPHYEKRFDSFLMICVNKPVKITDAKSGLLRRLIDVNPSGEKLPFRKYDKLMKQIDFELSGIAWHCLGVYKDLGATYYDNYIPMKMMGLTNDFYDFMETYYDVFSEADGLSFKQIWTLYKEYVDYANVQFPFSMRQVRVELEDYFKERLDNYYENGNHYTNYYIGFLKEKFPGRSGESETKEEKGGKNDNTVGSSDSWLNFNDEESLLDKGLEGCLAQYAGEDGKPQKSWDNVTTKLMDLDTKKLHYILVGDEHHIVIDFDIKGEDGKKSFKRNLEAASKFPPTYAELSKSGEGIHLHYIYDGDVEKLSRIYDDEIEVKVFTGKASLRRKLTKCCNREIAVISSGLPLKAKKGGKEPVIDMNVVNLEKALRTTIKKCLNKEVWDSTAPNVQFIKKILDDAYKSGKPYDVSDMRQAVLLFANNSTNQAKECIKLYKEMKWHSEVEREDIGFSDGSDEIIFYDIEVFPNLFIVCWKVDGNTNVVKMINPSSKDLEPLLKRRLVGFNNRGYDNHILYARWAYGYSNDKLYKLSDRIINGDKSMTDDSGKFKEAYNLSYADVYDFSTKKQSLKKWEIDLGLHHLENEYPWNKPIDESHWGEVADYCANDVIATEAVFHKCNADFKTRELLADLSGLTVNDTNRQHITKILVGNERKPKHIYTNLATGEQY